MDEMLRKSRFQNNGTLHNTLNFQYNLGCVILRPEIYQFWIKRRYIVIHNQPTTTNWPPLSPPLYILIYPHPPNARIYSKELLYAYMLGVLPPACTTDTCMYIMRILEATFQLLRKEIADSGGARRYID